MIISTILAYAGFAGALASWIAGAILAARALTIAPAMKLATAPASAR